MTYSARLPGGAVRSTPCKPAQPGPCVRSVRPPPGYVRGIAATDLKTHNARWLQPANGIVLSGINGFYRYGDAFLAVQNGVKPEGVVLFSVGLTTQEVLEANTPGLGEPPHSNAGWRCLLLHRQHRLGTLAGR